MKVLIVNKFLYPNGGSETYIFELGKQLISMGHEVQYFGMEHPDRCVGNSVGAYTTNMDFHGGSKLSKLSAPFKIIYSREARKKIRQVLDDFSPDVVHLNNINFQITPSIIYEIKDWGKKREKDLNSQPVKVVFTAHDYQWICPNHMLYIPQTGEVCEKCLGGKYVECAKNNCIHGSKMRSILGTLEGYYYKWRNTYAMVDIIICPSQFLYDKFATDGKLRDKLVVMHNFIGCDGSELNVAKNNGASYVLYFGRYDAQKGIPTLMEVCKLLPDIPFVFAGKGPLEEDIDQIDNITNVGFKYGDELKKLIADAAFSVYPSEWYENCPFSVMESQIYGTPVIGAEMGGIPELIQIDETDENSTGMLFTAGKVEELRERIDTLWSDKSRRIKYADNCHMLKFCDVKEYVENLLTLYKNGINI